jgi:general secretion pathway protein D
MKHGGSGPRLLGQALIVCLLAGGAIPVNLPGFEQAELDRESLRLREAGGVSALYDETVERPLPPEREPDETVDPEPVVEKPSLRRDTRDHLLDVVDHGWSRPEHPLRSREGPDYEKQEAALDRLKEIFIPKVEFRQLPLSEAVEALGEIALKHAPDGNGLNMVLIDPDGRDPLVSILLRRLSLKRVLDFVVESVAYAYDLQPDAVIIRPSQGPGFGLETAFYPLSRSTLIRLTGIREQPMGADPTGMVDPFAGPVDQPEDERSQTEQALKGFLQRAGIPFDGIEGANLALADGQLIVTQTPRNHDKLERLLRRYREVRQVEIEARFLEVQERNLEELGIEWTLIGEDGDRMGNAPARNLASAFSVGEEQSRIIIDRPGVELPPIHHGPPVLPINVDLAEEARDFLTLGTPLGELDLDVLIRALERQSGNDLLSAPKLTVLSGKTARIVVAEEFRYPESYGDTDAEVGMGDSTSGSAGVAITAGTPRSFTTRNVGVEMEVTPTVEEDNAISLLLKPTVTEFEGFVEYGGSSIAIASDTTVTVPSGFYQPVFSVREVRTEVTIWDGATLVMGGLVREHSVRIEDRIPLLGDLPLLGRLFRSEGESTQKRNLLIFVTARLVGPGGSGATGRAAAPGSD